MASRTFTYAEAVALLPEVRQLTGAACDEVKALQSQAAVDETPDLEGQIEVVLSRWVRAMEERGLEVKGPWLVDFDSGSGYFCWRHPEPGLHFFHTYESGFAGRVRIQ